jgi:heptosyltransferase-2
LAARTAQLLDGLGDLGEGTVFLIGGSGDAAHAQRLLAHRHRAGAVNACGLALAESLALLHRADLFVGTDSGPMNLAAAVGTPAFALFGATPVLSYSKFIHPLTPKVGSGPDGMQRILPAEVLDSVRPYLSRRKMAPHPLLRAR